MPVILNPDDYDLWLDPEVQDAKQLERGDDCVPGEYAGQQPQGR
jgi:hypothetical protein